MYGNRKPYPPEFRKEAVNLVKTSGKSIRSVADSLGIPFESLRVWVKRSEDAAGPRRDQQDSEAAELRRLRKECRDLREQCEILKKAAAFFMAETDWTPRQRSGSSTGRRPSTE
ncbi:MAG: transposase [Chloroflexi bacterium]|nr:transposase [Chloroflexota bacterium]OPZ65260.1 MAG: Transposase [Firmicutes bacterium ADurb.Bin506]